MSKENLVDDEFASFAKEKEAEQTAKGVGGYSKDYEEISYTGLEPNKVKIIRACGGVPDSGKDEFTARSVQLAWITGDNGKKLRVILPLKGTEEAHENILWKIISRVNETAWINKKKYYINETKNPELFNLINFNGLKEGDKKRVFERGWEGRQVLLMNVIDREQLKWHREHKHTMILSRNIGEGADGTKYPEEGVPVYGFIKLLSTTLFKHYGSWEKYDIGIIRTGQKDNPYRLFNATKFAAADMPELPEEMRQFVSDNNSLTSEEASWERYDLTKLFKVTSYTKILNRLKYTIGKIDSVFGSSYLKEIEDLAAKEKESWSNETQDNVSETSSAIPVKENNQEAIEAPTSAPVRSRAQAVKESNPVNDFSSIVPFWSKISSENQSEIIDVKTDSKGKIAEIKYNTTVDIVACPQCQLASPENWATCPNCGLDF